jgi:cytoskeletal protein RodZ
MTLGTVLRKWRLMSERDLRSVAKELKISPATLLRIEQGHVCDGTTLAKIINWLLRETKCPS